MRERSNWLRAMLRVSLSLAAQPPSMLMSWPGLEKFSPEIIALSAQYCISLETMSHFSESRTMREGRNEARIP